MTEPKKPSFEEQIQTLESIVNQLETPDLPLEQAMDCYEKGVKLAHQLNKTLVSAQERIELLAKEEDGSISSKPLVEEDHD